ncbi:glycosyltransferase family 2 protein [Lignipirellula cremea]|uniref:Undecaprenyl-phosphate 4-deoxy-4-formamido-L-arabinose transferase n=1 Tax=Lignipirellula cremea TaxID=2528010 RepID=A0A518DUD1_9BACT|nr:glycosyltransferase [Lignipirellula cremea]QDU95447.1 Undecaprenyl-phosphate 4-deoxy-4-formamido-L-arabinose transferase [Lignipirellula cremea]
MDRSLSIVLPVCNAQKQLVEQAPRLLEALSDLATRFELVIVDDGSTDQTEDVAVELARQYPQIRCVRHRLPKGQKAAIETGLEEASGEIVLVHDIATPLSEEELLRLWSLRNEKELVMARAEREEKSSSAAVVYRMMNLNDAPRRSTAGMQMIRREAAEQVVASEAVARRRPDAGPQHRLDPRMAADSRPGVDPDDRDVSGRRPPNFLSRMNRVRSRSISQFSE